jgi:ssDNA-binding Zn-finger/Zn-ribbon topoisomerase 1
MEWTKEKLAKRIQRAWHAAEDRGESLLGTTQLAQLAAGALLSPETWAVGDTIPAEVDLVDDSGGFRFERIRIAEGQDTGHWRVAEAPHLSEEDMLARFGPVRESTLLLCADQECADGSCEGCQQASSPAQDWPTVGEPCPKCRELPTAEDTRLSAIAGGCVRCPRCRGIFMDRNLTSRGVRLPAEVVDATIYCGEEHPDTGWVCDKPADHETGGEVGDQWHHWSNVGKTWMVIPESRVTIPTAGEETLTEQLARALEFLNYIITQGSAPGTATITKKIVNRAQGRARDLERALMWAADREAL